MTTKCYELVRGSALRVTGLTNRGALAEPHLYAVSKSVVKVTINEVVEAGGNEVIRNPEQDPRLWLVKPSQPIRYTVDIDFLRVDPELLSLITGVPVVINAEGDVVGFDAAMRLPVKAFALEVWSKVASRGCLPQWGYTLFPFLKGGLITGTAFANGRVSFNLRGAQTRRMSKWGVGPYWVDGWCKLAEPVSGNTHWRTMLTSTYPPLPTDGVVTYVDEIDGGTASMTTPDELDGGTPFEAGPCVVDGGAA